MFDGREKIGGPGKFVQIDESKIVKRKYYRGHVVEGQWVFGKIHAGVLLLQYRIERKKLC